MLPSRNTIRHNWPINIGNKHNDIPHTVRLLDTVMWTRLETGHNTVPLLFTREYTLYSTGRLIENMIHTIYLVVKVDTLERSNTISLVHSFFSVHLFSCIYRKIFINTYVNKILTESENINNIIHVVLY